MGAHRNRRQTAQRLGEPCSSSSSPWEALDRREWPQTEAEIYLLRSAMFAAQAIARDMEAAGRGDKIAEIARHISKVAPEFPEETGGNG